MTYEHYLQQAHQLASYPDGHLKQHTEMKEKRRAIHRARGHAWVKYGNSHADLVVQLQDMLFLLEEQK